MTPDEAITRLLDRSIELEASLTSAREDAERLAVALADTTSALHVTLMICAERNGETDPEKRYEHASRHPQIIAARSALAAHEKGNAMKSPKKPAWPRHKATPCEIVCGKTIAYRIPVDSLPAMVEAMAKVIGGTWGWKEHQRINDPLMDAFRNDARACLKAIGVEGEP